MTGSGWSGAYWSDHHTTAHLFYEGSGIYGGKIWAENRQVVR